MGEIHPQVKAAREKSLASDHLGALEILERALSSEPGCPELLAERGLLLTLLQREDEALECLLPPPPPRRPANSLRFCETTFSAAP